MKWKYIKDCNPNSRTEHFLFAKTKDMVSKELEAELNKTSISDISIVIEDDKFSCGLPYLHNNDTEIKLGTTYLSLLLRNCIFINSVILRDRSCYDEIYKYSVLASLFHEIGHIRNNHKTTDVKEREILADECENSVMYKLSEENKNAITGTLVNLFSLLELDVLMGRNPSKEYDNHPSTISRIESFCSKVPTKFYNDVVEITEWGFHTFRRLHPSLDRIISKNVNCRFLNSNPVSYIDSGLDKLDDDEEDI